MLPLYMGRSSSLINISEMALFNTPSGSKRPKVDVVLNSYLSNASMALLYGIAKYSEPILDQPIHISFIFGHRQHSLDVT